MSEVEKYKVILFMMSRSKAGGVGECKLTEEEQNAEGLVIMDMYLNKYDWSKGEELYKQALKAHAEKQILGGEDRGRS